MAGKIADELMAEFDGLFQKGGVELAQSLAETVKQLAVAPAVSAATTAETNTHGGSAPAKKDSGGGGLDIGSIATTVLEGGLGIVPLISGLAGLFGGGDSEAPPPLEKYTMPPAISFQSAELEGRLVASDFDQSGSARPYAPPPTAAAPQITVNVQAMDARSFMDYSGEIAQAVRGAMLNLSTLNDVVNDL
jgi:hypothetical protein